MSPVPGYRAATIQQQLRRHPVELRRRKDHRLMVLQRHRDTCVYGRCSRHGEPGFQPSPGSYALAVEVLATVRTTLARAGVRNEADFDLWTAVVVGLAGQQLANDPGGDRYIRLIDDAVTMFADHILDPS